MAYSIGITGTAKNTGKTTTTIKILDYAYQKGIKVGVTSIGYDGEEWDNVTGLAKPRLYLQRETIVALAEKCLISSTAEIELLDRTKLNTPLGRIVIGRVTKPGLVVVAGPNKGNELKMILDELERYECILNIVDGALNRIAPMTVVDGLIFTTGASRNIDPGIIAHEAKALSYMSQLPLSESIKDYNNVTLLSHEETIELNVPFILTPSDMEGLDKFKKFHTIYIPGTVSIKILKRLFEDYHDKKLIFYHPIHLIAGIDFVESYTLVRNFVENGGSLYFKKITPLHAFTINPFYPQFRLKRNYYKPAYIDKDRLKNEMKQNVNLPVFNVMEDDLTDFYNIFEAP